MDHVTTKKRSEIMSKIRGKNTAPELIVRKIVYSLGYRYRLHDKNLPGKPDLVFKGRKKVILIHGCFWHLHDCKKGRPPKSRSDYWINKLLANQARDVATIEKLNNLGWHVMVIWQCELKDADYLKARIDKFLGEKNG